MPLFEWGKISWAMESNAVNIPIWQIFSMPKTRCEKGTCEMGTLTVTGWTMILKDPKKDLFFSNCS